MLPYMVCPIYTALAERIPSTFFCPDAFNALYPKFCNHCVMYSLSNGRAFSACAVVVGLEWFRRYRLLVGG